MVDVSLTSAVYLSGPKPLPYNAGVAVAVTEVAYYDNSTGTVKLADADASASSMVAGIAVNTAAAGNPVELAGPGTRLTVNSVLTPGVTYYLSTTAGKICPFADLGSGDYVSAVCIAESATVLRVLAANLGVAL